MNKSKQTITLVLAGVLALGTGGLFVYDNIYLENQKKGQTNIIYVLKEDTKANTTITEDLFMEIEVPKNGTLPTYVTDISQVVGHKLSGSMMKNEVLTKMSVVSSQTAKEGDLEIRMVPNSTVNLKENDSVVVYLSEKVKGANGVVEVHFTRLFDKKTVVSKEEEGKVYNISGTEEEVMLYYKAKALGDIILVKRSDEFMPNKNIPVFNGSSYYSNRNKQQENTSDDIQ